MLFLGATLRASSPWNNAVERRQNDETVHWNAQSEKRTWLNEPLPLPRWRFAPLWPLPGLKRKKFHDIENLVGVWISNFSKNLKLKKFTWNRSLRQTDTPPFIFPRICAKSKTTHRERGMSLAEAPDAEVEGMVLLRLNLLSSSSSENASSCKRHLQRMSHFTCDVTFGRTISICEHKKKIVHHSMTS